MQKNYNYIKNNDIPNDYSPILINCKHIYILCQVQVYFNLFRNDTEKICVCMLTVNRTNQVENKNNIVGR